VNDGVGVDRQEVSEAWSGSSKAKWEIGESAGPGVFKAGSMPPTKAHLMPLYEILTHYFRCFAGKLTADYADDVSVIPRGAASELMIGCR
jgi:hypothetical protein